MERNTMKLKHILTEADIDMGNVFMKGVGPGGEPNPDQLTDEPETAVEDALDDIGDEFKSIDLEPKNVKEALGLTLAGVALSMPEIIKLIGKFVNLLSKIPGLKSLSGERLIAIGDKMHNKLLGGIEYALKKAGVRDAVKAKKFASILLHVVIAMLLIAGGISLSELVSKGSIKGATLKASLNAIKAKELRSFILTAAGKIA